MQTVLKVRNGRYMNNFPVKLHIDDDRITFEKAPFGLKDEIKSMAGPKWHGFDKDNPRKVWSVKNCPRNSFRLRHLMGEPVYAHFDQELITEVPHFETPLLPHQVDMLKRCLTYHFHILAAEQGLGKSLVAITLAQILGGRWWYIGPKPAGVSFMLELEKWGCEPDLFEEIMTYEKAQKITQYQREKVDGLTGLILDESSYVKNGKANRSIATQFIADSIREQTGNEGYVVLLSGTPTAKSPGDIWSQAEIAWPGFLREGSLHAFNSRYATLAKQELNGGVTFWKNEGWIDEEVEQLPKRLKGLMTTYRKKDWLDLPKKNFRRVRLEPSKKVLRVAKSLVHVASNAATALTWLRALSSGFQYVMEDTGELKECPACNMMPDDHDCPVCENTRTLNTKKQVTRMVKTPKEDALREEIDGLRRVIIPASFKGSIDRCQKIAHEMGFAVCRVDGRGWLSFDVDGEPVNEEPMRWWKTCPDPVAFVGNPGSCKFGLTLTEAKKMVFFDNDFSAENRLQMIDRFHRIGQDEEVEIVDFIHLPVDEKVLDVLDSNRSMELVSLGSLDELFDVDAENIELE